MRDTILQCHRWTDEQSLIRFSFHWTHFGFHHFPIKNFKSCMYNDSGVYILLHSTRLPFYPEWSFLEEFRHCLYTLEFVIVGLISQGLFKCIWEHYILFSIYFYKAFIYSFICVCLCLGMQISLQIYPEAGRGGDSGSSESRIISDIELPCRC